MVTAEPKRGRTPGVNWTEWLADQLRELILSGEWEHGRLVPTQKELERQHRLSTITVRNAVKLLVQEGLIVTNQGKRSWVHNPEPAYQLVVDWHATDRVADPPMSFLADPQAAAPERQCDECEPTVPKRFAKLLRLDAGVPMVQRVIKLIGADGVPILMWYSFVPVELANDARGWHDTEVGYLALTGYRVTSQFAEQRVRMPTPKEFASLAMVRGVAVEIISRPCQVLVGERTVPAGVVVLAPSDRVFLRWSDSAATGRPT